MADASARVRCKVPYVPQMEAVECGAAALAMVLAYFRHHAPLSEVTQACGISRDGSTASNIVAAARAYGLEPLAQRTEPANLADLEVPAILEALPSGVRVDGADGASVFAEVALESMPAGAGPARSGMTFAADILTRRRRVLSLLFGPYDSP